MINLFKKKKIENPNYISSEMIGIDNKWKVEDKLSLAIFIARWLIPIYRSKYPGDDDLDRALDLAEESLDNIVPYKIKERMIDLYNKPMYTVTEPRTKISKIIGLVYTILHKIAVINLTNTVNVKIYSTNALLHVINKAIEIDIDKNDMITICKKWIEENLSIPENIS